MLSPGCHPAPVQAGGELPGIQAQLLPPTARMPKVTSEQQLPLCAENFGNDCRRPWQVQHQAAIIPAGVSQQADGARQAACCFLCRHDSLVFKQYDHIYSLIRPADIQVAIIVPVMDDGAGGQVWRRQNGSYREIACTVVLKNGKGPAMPTTK